MRYKKTFATRQFGIRLSADTKRMVRFVDNYLDFITGPSFEPEIMTDLHIRENLPGGSEDKKGFLRPARFFKNMSLVSPLGQRLASVSVYPKARIVKARLLNYEESMKERILDFILFQPLRVILAHRGLFSLHASAVAKEDECVLISGEQNCGKSTLAFVLARNGFKFVSDDDCFIKSQKNSLFLFPFPTKMGLKDKMADRYRDLKRYVVKNYYYGDKRRFSLKHMYDLNGGAGYRCRIILFPKYHSGRNVSVKEISKEEALARLSKENLATQYLKKKKELYIRNFWALHALTKEAGCFELTYNDKTLEGIPSVVRNLFTPPWQASPSSA